MTRTSPLSLGALAAFALLVAAACGSQTVRVEPVKVEPIHLTVDINLHDVPAGTTPRP